MNVHVLQIRNILFYSLNSLVYFFFYLFIDYFSSNKSLADSLDECVDPRDPNFNKVPNFNLSFIFVIHASLQFLRPGTGLCIRRTETGELLQLIYYKRLTNLGSSLLRVFEWK